MIGDCETAALIGLDGSIDWLCWPRFDSDACFAALLGTPEHGRWLLAPCAADFVVKEGESVPFVLRYAPSHLPDVELTDAQKALASTERFWREWVEKGQRIARWSDAVTRSLITLRALIYAPTGGIVVARTTSLRGGKFSKSRSDHQLRPTFMRQTRTVTQCRYCGIRGRLRRICGSTRSRSRKRLLAVAHTDEGDIIRIISARAATRREKKFYEEG